ncbi:MAG: hypothetical protein WBX25_30735 [Rhodomicrobium sp.]
MKLANSNPALRKALEALESVPIGQHQAKVEKLAELHSHSIQFVSYKPGDLTCAAYTLGLAYNRTYRSLACWASRGEIDPSVLAGSAFMIWILDACLLEISEPRAGCLVCYFADGMWKRIGVISADRRVTSKWGTFPVYEHALAEVQKSYGDEVRFFERPSPQDALALFLQFASEKGVLPADVEEARADCLDLWTDEALT